MATVLEGCTTEEQRSVVRFLCAKWLNAKIFIKKYFLFTVESACRLKKYITSWKNFRWWRRNWNESDKVVETTVRRLLCWGFRRTGRAMGQCINVVGGYVENFFFRRFEYHMFYFLYPFVIYLLTPLLVTIISCVFIASKRFNYPLRSHV
jgi:hypothetical protein